MLDDKEILLNTLEYGKEPEECCKALIGCANGKGGIDNITVILLYKDN